MSSRALAPRGSDQAPNPALRRRAAGFLMLGTCCLAAACGSTDPAPEANRQTEDGIRRFVVTAPIETCPTADHFRESVDELLAGDPGHPLPPDCRIIEPGEIVLAETKGSRPAASYEQFVYEAAMLADGTTIWSDQFNDDHLDRTKDGTRPKAE